MNLCKPVLLGAGAVVASAYKHLALGCGNSFGTDFRAASNRCNMPEDQL